MTKLLIHLPETLKAKLDALRGPGLYRKRVHQEPARAGTQPTPYGPEGPERTVKP